MATYPRISQLLITWQVQSHHCHCLGNDLRGCFQRAEIKQLVTEIESGDHLFFYCEQRSLDVYQLFTNLRVKVSGHGTQVDDTDWDEVDGKDEGKSFHVDRNMSLTETPYVALIACDGRLLIDDELHQILVKPVPAGCRLTVRQNSKRRERVNDDTNRL